MVRSAFWGLLQEKHPRIANTTEVGKGSVGRGPDSQEPVVRRGLETHRSENPITVFRGGEYSVRISDVIVSLGFSGFDPSGKQQNTSRPADSRQHRSNRRLGNLGLHVIHQVTPGTHRAQDRGVRDR